MPTDPTRLGPSLRRLRTQARVLASVGAWGARSFHPDDHARVAHTLTLLATAMQHELATLLTALRPGEPPPTAPRPPRVRRVH